MKVDIYGEAACGSSTVKAYYGELADGTQCVVKAGFGKRGEEDVRREAAVLGLVGSCGAFPTVYFAGKLDLPYEGLTARGYAVCVERVRGKTLYGFANGVHEHGMAVAEVWAARFLRRLLAELDVLHRAGVLHRDLHGDNVFVTPGGPRIIDFGSSAFMSDGVVRDACSISNGVHPPEAINPWAPWTPASDVYEAAACMALVMHGKRGLPAANERTALDDCLAVMTRDNPKDRPGDCRQAIELIECCLREHRFGVAVVQKVKTLVPGGSQAAAGSWA